MTIVATEVFEELHDTLAEMLAVAELL
jgi:hypothetical protein